MVGTSPTVPTAGPGAQLLDGPDRPHAAASTRDAATRASNVSSRSGARSSIAASLARDRGFVAAGDGAGERVLRAVARPSSRARRGRAGRAARAARRRWPRAARPGPPGDQEVRGDRGGGVVGGAVLVGDLDGAHLERVGERRGGPQRASVVPATAHPAPAKRRRAALRHRHQRVEAEAFAVAEDVEGRRAGAVPEHARASRRPPPPRGSRRPARVRSTTGASGLAPRPSGPSTSMPASRSAAASAWPSLPAPTMAQRSGVDSEAIRSSSRMRYRLGKRVGQWSSRSVPRW